MSRSPSRVRTLSHDELQTAVQPNAYTSVLCLSLDLSSELFPELLLPVEEQGLLQGSLRRLTCPHNDPSQLRFNAYDTPAAIHFITVKQQSTKLRCIVNGRVPHFESNLLESS